MFFSVYLELVAGVRVCVCVCELLLNPSTDWRERAVPIWQFATVVMSDMVFALLLTFVTLGCLLLLFECLLVLLGKEL